MVDGDVRALADRMRSMVTAGEIPAERILATRLGITRHRLRTMLTLLREEGTLPPARPGRRALQFSDRYLAQATNPLEIIELRQILEPSLARFAALRASPLEIARIERSTRTPPAADIETAAAVDYAFHRAVAAGARNGLAAGLYSLLRQVACDARLRTGSAPCADRLRRRDSEHAAVAAAIASRDADAAERAMADHLDAVHRRVLDRLSPRTSAA